MMFRPLQILWIIIIVALFQSIAAEAAASLFEQGNTLYERQAYDSAAQCYEKMLASGMANAAVYYNLGNAYFRMQKPGLAMLNLEKARKLEPNDKDIAANIRFIQSTIVDRIPAPQQSFLEVVLRHLHMMLSLSAQLWLVFGGLLVLSLLFAAALFAPFNLRLWIIYVSSFILLITGALGISAGIKIYNNERVHYAVVLSPTVDAMNQPSGATVLFTVHEGTTFRVRQQVGDWSLVSLPTGVSGWVVTSSLGMI